MAEPQSAMQDVVDVTIELQEELRELLSWLRDHSDDDPDHTERTVGRVEKAHEVADRLEKILDGEGPCPHENASTEPNRNDSMACRDCGSAL